MVVIDFETRSRLSIKSGSTVYAASASVMCLGIWYGPGDTELWIPQTGPIWLPGEPLREWENVVGRDI